VYDVTEFLSRHPAGGRIIQMHGGRDCTSAFLDVHAESYLTQFLPASAFKGVLAGSGVADAPKAKLVGKYWQPEEVLSVKRTVFAPEQEEYRKQFRAFIAKNIHPIYPKSVDSRRSRSCKPESLLELPVSMQFQLHCACIHRCTTFATCGATVRPAMTMTGGSCRHALTALPRARSESSVV
jgi:hypothetical protein